MLAQDRFEALLQRVSGADGRVAEIELQLERAGNDVGRSRAGVHVRRLPRRGREVFVAFIPAHRRKLGDRRRHKVDWISGQMGIRDVPLHPAHGQRTGQRPAPAILDHVAESVDRRRLADDAVVQFFAGVTEPIDDLDRAVGGGSFLIGGDKQRDRATDVRVRGDEAFDRDDERGDRGLHVGGAATVQVTVALGGHERVGVPGVERSGGHDIGMAREADDGPRATPARPQVGYAVGSDGLASESERFEARAQDVLASAVVGRRRAARDQLTGQRQRRLARRYAPAGIHCWRLRNSGSISSLTKSPERLCADSSWVCAAERVVGEFWLTSHARLVGESDAISASS